jgi:hypothetical protein
MKQLSHKQVRKLWVEALRSGKYQQARGVLSKKLSPSKGGQGFCCLGVLCELAVKYKIISEPTLSGNQFFYDGQNEVLSSKVRHWVGLKTILSTCLTSLNDHDKKTFKTIADVIESEPSGLFI